MPRKYTYGPRPVGAKSGLSDPDLSAWTQGVPPAEAQAADAWIAAHLAAGTLPAAVGLADPVLQAPTPGRARVAAWWRGEGGA